MVDVESIRNTIRQSVNRITGIAPSDIQDASDYRADLGLDSLSALEVMVDIEYAYKIKVSEERFQSIRTVETRSSPCRNTWAPLKRNQRPRNTRLHPIRWPESPSSRPQCSRGLFVRALRAVGQVELCERVPHEAGSVDPRPSSGSTRRVLPMPADGVATAPDVAAARALSERLVPLAETRVCRLERRGLRP
jgi:acyl carrier protein